MLSAAKAEDFRGSRLSEAAGFPRQRLSEPEDVCGGSGFLSHPGPAMISLGQTHRSRVGARGGGCEPKLLAGAVV